MLWQLPSQVLVVPNNYVELMAYSKYKQQKILYYKLATCRDYR